MGVEHGSDYEFWMRLANDPRQSEEARQHYREQMDTHMKGRLRAAFRFAAAQNPMDKLPNDEE
jgi:hypothetical protein